MNGKPDKTPMPKFLKSFAVAILDLEDGQEDKIGVPAVLASALSFPILAAGCVLIPLMIFLIVAFGSTVLSVNAFVCRGLGLVPRPSYIIEEGQSWWGAMGKMFKFIFG